MASSAIDSFSTSTEFFFSTLETKIHQNNNAGLPRGRGPVPRVRHGRAAADQHSVHARLEGRGREREREKRTISTASLPLRCLSLPVLFTHLFETNINNKTPFSSCQAHLHLDQGPRRRRGPAENPRLRQQALARLLRGRVGPGDRRV